MNAKNPLLAKTQNLGSKIKNFSSEQSKTPDGLVELDKIIVQEQVRKEFEDGDNSLQEMADDIAIRGVLQPILIRPSAGGKFVLVAGERRFRAAKLAGLKTIPALIKEMTEEEADEAQFIENIHRKNLTLQEQATRVQRDLDKFGGDVDAVLKKYNKEKTGKAWVSKMLSLLDLPEQTQRLIDENITADKEVINSVKQIEKHDPNKAKEVVDTLKNSRKDGAGKAREIASSAKVATKRKNSQNATDKISDNKQGDSLNIAAPRNRDAEQPSEVVSIFPDAVQPTNSDVGKQDYTHNMESITLEDLQSMEPALKEHFESGATATDWTSDVLKGLKSGTFGHTGQPAANLAAYAQGFSKKTDKLDLALTLQAIQEVKE